MTNGSDCFSQPSFSDHYVCTTVTTLNTGGLCNGDSIHQKG
uniref:Uncharacterized protein n=1 Tax=Anguilla anguilla TaxID=7936 RepID=A0A0E9TMN7_ANGAN